MNSIYISLCFLLLKKEKVSATYFGIVNRNNLGPGAFCCGLCHLIRVENAAFFRSISIKRSLFREQPPQQVLVPVAAVVHLREYYPRVPSVAESVLQPCRSVGVMEPFQRPSAWAAFHSSQACWLRMAVPLR